jgi:hypothetical protein
MAEVVLYTPSHAVMRLLRKHPRRGRMAAPVERHEDVCSVQLARKLRRAGLTVKGFRTMLSCANVRCRSDTIPGLCSGSIWSSGLKIARFPPAFLPTQQVSCGAPDNRGFARLQILTSVSIPQLPKIAARLCPERAVSRTLCGTVNSNKAGLIGPSYRLVCPVHVVHAQCRVESLSSELT